MASHNKPRLTESQRVVIDMVTGGAEVCRVVGVKTTTRGAGFSMVRTCKYRYRGRGGGALLGRAIDPRTAESLERRGLIKITKLGSDDPLKEMMEAMVTNHREERKARHG